MPGCQKVSGKGCKLRYIKIIDLLHSIAFRRIRSPLCSVCNEKLRSIKHILSRLIDDKYMFERKKLNKIWDTIMGLCPTCCPIIDRVVCGAGCVSVEPVTCHLTTVLFNPNRDSGIHIKTESQYYLYSFYHLILNKIVEDPGPWSDICIENIISRCQGCDKVHILSPTFNIYTDIENAFLKIYSHTESRQLALVLRGLLISQLLML
jgi:hypothetical protein